MIRADLQADRDGPHLLLYDGPCGFCNGIVRFVLDHDRRGEDETPPDPQDPGAFKLVAGAGFEPATFGL
jgi:predicted DCC family thiol-disulfide oxidoreductase YuxK